MATSRQFNIVIGAPETEAILARRSKPHDVNWEKAFEVLRLSPELRGVKILDIGAGTSDFVPRLLDLGADAYAVDPRYKRMSDLRGEVRKFHRSFSKMGLLREYVCCGRGGLGST